MKILRCDPCNRNQQTGKFCLDCGRPLKEIVTTAVKFKPIDTNRTADTLKRDVRKWLERIGVQQPDIKIASEGGAARIEYILKNNTYTFMSHMQDTITKNLAAVEQFLHYRVLSIERGIETIEKAFAGYEALPDYTTQAQDPYQALGFREPVDIHIARKKFRALVKRYHPDTNPNKDTHEEFNRIKAAMITIEKRCEEAK